LLLVFARHALTVAKRNHRRRRRWQQCRRHPSIVMITEPLHTFSTVPETSYSSSEGEDDFFDANDSPFTSSQLNTPTRGLRESFADMRTHWCVYSISKHSTSSSSSSSSTCKGFPA
uniref:Uncharacterized protein n=1 Tax=Anopheles melas TaxID=34690 RepID=A0A182TZD7_9DIPT